MYQYAMQGFSDHDHARCETRLAGEAERLCAARGLRLTPLRRRVLEVLAESHRAYGAYDVLERLRAEGVASQPPSVYRALDFLVAQGFAHRVERLSAFVACAQPGRDHDPAFLICRACETVAETPMEPSQTGIGPAARSAGFAVERVCVEGVGLCPACA